MVKGEKIEYTPDSWRNDLSPPDQEVICQEYLRMKIDSNLPILQSLLCPTGRTMKDIDIVGLSKDNKLIIAQVTYLGLDSILLKKKVDSLKKYLDKNTHLIMFCSGIDKSEFRDNIVYYPIDTVMKKFLDTDMGRNYLEAKKKLCCEENIEASANALHLV